MVGVGSVGAIWHGSARLSGGCCCSGKGHKVVAAQVRVGGKKEDRVGWVENVVRVGGCGREGMSMGVGVGISGARRPRWARRKSRLVNVPEADFRPCGGSCPGSWLQELVWLLGRWEKVRGSSGAHLHIRWVRLRFLWGLGEGVAVSWMELVELGWCMAAESPDVWRSWLAIVSWLACGSVAVTQLEHCGGGWAGAVDAWASLVV